MLKKYRAVKVVGILFSIALFLVNPTVSKGMDLSPKLWGSPVVINDINKSWSIKLNHKLKESTINSYNIFMEDEAGNKVDANVYILGDKKSIKISPLNPYKNLKTYRIYIDEKIENEKGKKLGSPVLFQFKVLERSSTSSIKEIGSSTNSFFTQIKVTTSRDTYKIYLDNIEATYKGNGEYSGNILGRKLGDKIKVKAYDSEDKLIDELEYTISK